jgi:hypothetical protein
MGVPTSEVGYTFATTGMGDHEVQKGHVVALGKKRNCKQTFLQQIKRTSRTIKYKVNGIRHLDCTIEHKNRC